MTRRRAPPALAACGDELAELVEDLQSVGDLELERDDIRTLT